MNSNVDYKCVNATFEGLQELIQSNGTYLFPENLKIHIENLSKQFELKKELKIKCCLICDNLDNKSALIDALLKEKISDKLRSNHQYLVKSDPSIQKTIIGDENQKLSSITVGKERLKLLNNSNIVLSFEKYSQFLEEIQMTNAYKPDVVVLVINSPKDLEKEDIQSFFNTIKDKFNDENLFFVLNEGHEVDCTATNICDVCYPSNIRYLFSGHKLENREFKISASRCLSSQSKGKSDVLDENYRNLLKTLEDKLDINQQTDNIKIEIDSFLQAIKVKELKASINESSRKLNEKSAIILNKIDNHESKSINDVKEILGNLKIKNRKSKLKTFLDENSNKLYTNLQNDLLNLTNEISKNGCNKSIESLFINLMHEHGLKEEHIKNKSYELFDKFIDKQYPENVVEENVNEQNNNEGFIKSAIEITKGIFGYAKDRFISFKKSFETKATSIVIKMETRIDQAIINTKFHSGFENFNIYLNNKIKQKEENLMNSMKKTISKYGLTNFVNENHLQSELISTINKEIDEMSRMEEEIKIFLPSSCKFSNEKCSDYFKNYFPKTDFKNFLERYKTKLNSYIQTIQDDKYYIDFTIPGEAIGSVCGAAIGALLTVPIPILIPFGALVGGLFGASFGRANGVEIRQKLLKSAIVLKELEQLKGDLSKERDKIIELLLTSWENFV